MPEEKQSFETYLLDTNHCSRLLYGDQSLIRKLTGLSDCSLVTCVIVSGELYFMAYKSKHKEANLTQIENFLRDLVIYPVSEEVSKTYGEIKASIISYFGPKESEKRRKIKIDEIGFTENDLWIAAIAKQNNFVIVSADSDFIRMKDIISLKVENWLTP